MEEKSYPYVFEVVTTEVRIGYYGSEEAASYEEALAKVRKLIEEHPETFDDDNVISHRSDVRTFERKVIVNPID